MISIILPGIFFGGLALIIVLIVASSRFGSNSKQTQREDVEKMIKTVYIYLVLFVTLMMVIGGSVSTFMALAEIVAPSPYYQSFEDFQRQSYYQYSRDGEVEQEFTQEELRERYEASVKEHENRQVRSAQNNLIKSFGWIIIPFPVFLFFQKQLGHSKLTKD